MLAPPIWSTPDGLSESVVPGKTSDPATVNPVRLAVNVSTVDVESIGGGNRTGQIDCRVIDDQVPHCAERYWGPRDVDWRTSWKNL